MACLLKVTVDGFFVRQMKTRWGSCNPAAGAIPDTTDLTVQINPENRVGARTPSATLREAGVNVAAGPDRNADGYYLLAHQIPNHAHDDL